MERRHSTEVIARLDEGLADMADVLERLKREVTELREAVDDANKPPEENEHA